MSIGMGSELTGVLPGAALKQPFPGRHLAAFRDFRGSVGKDPPTARAERPFLT